MLWILYIRGYKNAESFCVPEAVSLVHNVNDVRLSYNIITQLMKSVAVIKCIALVCRSQNISTEESTKFSGFEHNVLRMC